MDEEDLTREPQHRVPPHGIELLEGAGRQSRQIALPLRNNRLKMAFLIDQRKQGFAVGEDGGKEGA